jgi:hypothetical protein
MSAEQIAAAAVGGALVTAGIARQGLVRRAAGRALRVALRDPEPLVRAAAVQTAGESGIGRNARLLLAVAKEEQDIWVRQVIAETVNRHLWEPPTAKALVELRIWAKQQVMSGQVEAVGAVEESRAVGVGGVGGAEAAVESVAGAGIATGSRAVAAIGEVGAGAVAGVAAVPAVGVGAAAVAAGEGSTAGGDGVAAPGIQRNRSRTSAVGRGWDAA